VDRDQAAVKKSALARRRIDSADSARVLSSVCACLCHAHRIGCRHVGRQNWLQFRNYVLDSDLAELYGVETRILVQAVKRNLDRFPIDFMFQM
jgi:ABC-type transporter Mla MlaB component